MNSITFLFLFLLSIAATADPLFHSCNSTANISAAGAANLNRLFSLLSKTAPKIGFGLASIGKDANKINGLALCRGDMNSSACGTCIRAASTQIRRKCPFKKDAIIWFDNCLLRYSDIEFFGEVDNEHKFYTSLSLADEEFDAEVMEMMDWLRMRAYLSPLMFATRVNRVSNGSGLYGLAQCSRDLSGGDCNKCLEKAIGEIVGGKRGGRVLGGSCYVRYERYPFFDS